MTFDRIYDGLPSFSCVDLPSTSSRSMLMNIYFVTRTIMGNSKKASVNKTSNYISDISYR